MKPASCLLLALLVVATQSQAAEPGPSGALLGEADEAQFYFSRGNRAYQDRQFEDALAS